MFTGSGKLVTMYHVYLWLNLPHGRFLAF